VNLKDTLQAAGRSYLERVLAEKRGNVTKAAMEAEVSRQGFYKLARRYGVIVPLVRCREA
jgi:DNA-binding NtrC family response regulator